MTDPNRDRFRDLDDDALYEAMARAWCGNDTFPDGYKSATAIRHHVRDLHAGRVAPETAADRAALAVLDGPDLLSVECPTCYASIGELCVPPVSSLHRAHPARERAVGLDDGEPFDQEEAQ